LVVVVGGFAGVVFVDVLVLVAVVCDLEMRGRKVR